MLAKICVDEALLAELVSVAEVGAAGAAGQPVGALVEAREEF